MEWFRFYSRAVHDPKVQRLPDKLFKFWVNCLCLASENNGHLPGATDLAFHLRLSEQEINSRINLLSSLKTDLFDRTEAGIVPHNWERWQYKSDDSRGRVVKYRNKLKESGFNTASADKHRKAVYERDGNTCGYCGSTEKLCLDHIVPVSRGGPSIEANLITSCKSCNSGKQGRTPVEAGYTPVTEFHRRLVTDAVTKFLLPVTTPVTAPVTTCHGDKTATVTHQNRTEQNRTEQSRERGASAQPKDNGGSTTLQPPFNHPCEMVDPLVDEWLQPKGNSPSPSPSPDKTISPKPSWTIDELFVRFSQAYREAKPDSIDEDFTVAYRNWTALDFEQRLSAVDGIKQRVKCGRWSDPKYIPKPRKYLEAEWKRPVLSGDDDEPQYPRVMM